VSQVQVRIVGSAAAFAFADVWVVAGFTSAVACALAAVTGYGIVVAVQRQAPASLRAALSGQRSRLRGRLGSPKPARRPRARAGEPPTAESTYGW
jgi:hypothetical protein